MLKSHTSCDFSHFLCYTVVDYKMVKERREMLRRVVDFIRLNHEKKMTLQAYMYAAFYRICILTIPMTKLEKMLGERGEESCEEESREHVRMAKLVRFHVNRVASHTPWESKCLVRAMTARKLLEKHHISSTLYLGVGKENGKMVAHAWLRSGRLYVTGGNGSQYGMVAKFRTVGR